MNILLHFLKVNTLLQKYRAIRKSNYNMYFENTKRFVRFVPGVDKKKLVLSIMRFKEYFPISSDNFQILILLLLILLFFCWLKRKYDFELSVSGRSIKFEFGWSALTKEIDF